MNEEHPLNILAEQAEKQEKTQRMLDQDLNLGSKKYVQEPIRTYESDVAKIMASNRTSKASMVLAETKKREELRNSKVENSEESLNKTKVALPIKKILSVALGIVFISGGFYAGFYFYNKSVLANPPAPEVKKVIPSIISSDSQKLISIDGMNGKEILQSINSNIGKSKQGTGKIYEVILTTKSGEIVNAITAPSFLEKANIEAPNQFTRSLSNRMMIGGIKDNQDENINFLVFTTDFFQNSYAGMLFWEKDMANELEDIMDYRSKIDKINENASSTINNYFGIRGKFIDKQIKNRDIREFIHESGNPMFLYSFIDKNTLIITENEDAFSRLIDKIEKQTYIR